MVLSVMVGNGTQLCAMCAVTLGNFFNPRPFIYYLINFPIVFALLGFLSPSNRGSLATVMMVCWTLFGG